MADRIKIWAETGQVELLEPPKNKTYTILSQVEILETPKSKHYAIISQIEWMGPSTESTVVATIPGLFFCHG